MRVIFSVIGILLAFAVPSSRAETRIETRVALVIGNGAYQHLHALKNPPNDARDLAAALTKLDFDVDLGVDLPLVEMQRKLTAFARRAQTADVALAFFAGHGVQAPDQRGSAQAMNYLLPIDADIKDEVDLGFLVTARDILARLQAAGKIRILILDACRDNPIPQRLARGRGVSVPRGLSPEPKTSGTLIAYSTQPDTIADDGSDRNSPFVKALLDRIAEPGIDIRLMFADVRREVIERSHGAQTPETSDSLDGRFVFRAASPPASAASPPAEAPSPPAGSPPSAASSPKPSDDIGAYVANILGNIEREWVDVFRQSGLTYRKPNLVLYRGMTQAACGGVARRSMGPFYCPQDQKIYLDSVFFREIESQFHGCGNSCEFAQAYLIAHEVGHHVQNLMGITAKVQNIRQQQQTDRASANRLQTRMELQADCFAGFWVHQENERFRKEGQPPVVEAGDIEASLRGASTAGDEMVRREAAGKVMPDNFNHGTAEQRSRWFNAGYQGSSIAACNTFKSTD